MPTRYYLPSIGAAAVSPGIDAAWNSNTASPSRLAMVQTRIGSAMANVGPISEGPGALQYNVFFRQYVSEPIGAGEITGTVQGFLRAAESNTAANANGQIIVKVVSNDGATVRGFLYMGTTTTGTGNPTGEFTTTLSSRQFPGTGEATVSAVTAQNGDRIVVELGTRNHNAVTTNYTTTLNFGDNSATDLTTTAGVTAANNPWVEFSADIPPYSPSGDPKSAPDSQVLGSSDTASVEASDNPPVDRTIHLVADTHINWALPSRLTTAQNDIVAMSSMSSHVIHLGDLIDGGTAYPGGVTWFNGLPAARHAIAGNHDMNGHTIAEWETDFGQPRNWTFDIGDDWRVIGVSMTANSVTLDATALGFLESELSGTTRDCVIVAHAPLTGSGNAGSGTDIEPAATIFDMLVDHPHARVWIHGHTHAPVTHTNANIVLNLGGGRSILCLTPGAVAYVTRTATPQETAGHLNTNALMSLLPNRVEARFRDAAASAWMTVGGTDVLAYDFEPIEEPPPVGSNYPPLITGRSDTVAYWRLGETSGDALDSSGHNRTMTVVGSPTYGVTGILGGGGDTGIRVQNGSYFTRGSEPVFNPTTEDFTIIAWVRVTGANTTGLPGTVIGKASGSISASRQYRINHSSSADNWRVSVYSGSSVYHADAATLPTMKNVWTMVAMVRSGTSLYIVENGTWSAATTIPSSINSTSGPLQIGYFTSNSPYNGSVDEVSFHNTALTSAEIAALYNAGINAPAVSDPKSAPDTQAVSSSDTATNVASGIVADSQNLASIDSAITGAVATITDTQALGSSDSATINEHATLVVSDAQALTGIDAASTTVLIAGSGPIGTVTRSPNLTITSNRTRHDPPLVVARAATPPRLSVNREKE